MKIINKVQNNIFLRIAFVTGFILLIPLVAMQFTDEVVWTLSDFVIAGSLFFSTGLILVLATRRFPRHRVIIGVLVAIAFIWFWAELAVGIFTNWGS